MLARVGEFGPCGPVALSVFMGPCGRPPPGPVAVFVFALITAGRLPDGPLLFAPPAAELLAAAPAGAAALLVAGWLPEIVSPCALDGCFPVIVSCCAP